MLKYSIKKSLLIFIVFSTYTSAQQTSIPMQIEKVPFNILNDIKQFFSIDYSKYKEYEDIADAKAFFLDDKYLLWFSHWSTASNYTALVFADSSRILSFKEYFDRTPFSLIELSHDIIQINYNYGCCDGRYQIGSFYNLKNKCINEFSTVLFAVDRAFYHDNRAKYDIRVLSSHTLQVEEESRYDKIRINSVYKITKISKGEDPRRNDFPSSKINVSLIYFDNLFNTIQTDDKYLKDLLECFYCYESTCSENCYELYSKENRYTSHWKEEWVKVIDPFLMFIARLELK